MEENKKDYNIKALWIVFIGMLLFSLFAEFLMHPHAEFGIEGTFFFNAWFGFLSCAFIVGLANFIGVFLKRRESYYKEVDRDK